MTQHLTTSSAASAPSGKSSSKESVRVLVIEGNESANSMYRQVLHGLGYRGRTAESFKAALAAIDAEPVDIILADINCGIASPEFLRQIKQNNARVEIGIVTPSSGVAKAERALKYGASQYLVKPFTTSELRALIQQMAEKLGLKDENRYLRERLESKNGFGRLIGQSLEMHRVFKTVQKVAFTRSPC
jgi:DNA-binding NtrC family response regulator